MSVTMRRPVRIGEFIRGAGRRIGQAAYGAARRVGDVLNRAVRSGAQKLIEGTGIAEGALDVAGGVRDQVARLNRSTSGLLEEGVRALPFGNQVVRGANAVSRGIDAARTVVRKVRKGAQTVERARRGAARQVRQAFT